GRVFGSAGDSVIAEFASPVEAVRCALEIQQEVKTRNAELAEDRRMQFRIGVNLGDVVAEGDNLYGDGVNVAARLEEMCEAGEVCISGKVHEEVAGKIEGDFRDAGEHHVKNIARPVRIWRWSPKAPAGERSHRAGGLLKESKTLALPDKPSIAVLPFGSMSADPELEFFADGMTEEIITALSRVPDLFVIARNSTFAYKGRAVGVPRVAEELGVRCVLEGSVRAAGQKVRVTAQLIEGATGHHLWAERYDGDLSDIFEVQDDITRNIVMALQIKLTYGELARLWEGQTNNLRAWEKMVEGRRLFNQMIWTDILNARRLFEEAVALDPSYGGALIQLGLTHWWEARYVLESDVEEALARAEKVIDRLLDLGRESGAHYLRGYVAFIRRQHDEAIVEIERAVALSPSDSWIIAVLGQVYIFAGQAEKGTEALTRAMRLSPYYPDWYPYNLVLAYAWTGDRDKEQEAIDMAKAYIGRLPSEPYGYTNLAIVQAFYGRDAEAAATIGSLRARFPGFGAKNLRRSELYKDAENLDRVLMVLSAAGLPE
ncbi:MAG: adenylate/guanylate cyclase domain-containing protein, partial [Alphaproteobacteria bacterium]